MFPSHPKTFACKIIKIVTPNLQNNKTAKDPQIRPKNGANKHNSLKIKNEIIDLTIDDMDVETHEDEVGTNYENKANPRDFKISAVNNISNSINTDKTINDTSVVNTNNKTKVKIEIEDDMERQASQHCADIISKNFKPKHEEIYVKNETPQLEDSEINTKQDKIKDTSNTKQNICAEQNSKDDTVRDNVTSVTNHITPKYDYTHGRTTTLKTYTRKRNNNSDTSVKLEPIDNDIEGQLLPNADQDLCQDLLVKAEHIYIKEEVTEIDDNETQIKHLYVNNDIINGAQDTCKNNLKYRNWDTKIPVTTLFKCHKCDFSTNKQISFSMHMENAHYDYSSTYLCDYCDYKSDKTNLKLHMSIMHENEVVTYSCDYCDYTNVSKHNLKSHLRLKHKNDKYDDKYTMEVLNSDLFTMMTSTIRMTLDTNKSTTRAEGSKNKNKTKEQISNAIKAPNETQTSVKEKTSQHSATCDSFITSYNVHGCNNTIAAVTNYQTTPKLEEIDHDIEGQLLLNKNEDLTNLVVKNEEIDVKQEVTEVDYNETQEKKHSLINKDITQSKRKNNVEYRNCDTKNDVTTLYECHKCEFYSHCKESFTRHWKNTHNVYKHTYSCDLCDFKSNRINLKSHMAIMHVNKVAKFVCDYCNYTNFSKHNLETHLRLKHKKVIDAMGFLTNGKNDLVTMMTTTVPVTKATNKSKTRFKNKNKTKSNAIKTPNETQTSVKEKTSQHSTTCDSFITSYNVHGCNNTIAAVTNYQTTPKLEEIDHDIEGQLLLNKHEGLTNLVVKNEGIDVKQEVTKVDYNETPEMEHSLINKDITQSKRENNVKYRNCDIKNDVTTLYECHKCQFYSHCKASFTRHMINTHNVYKHTYSCDLCDFKSNRINLKSHMAIMHVNKVAKFVCDYCNYTNFSKHNLETHLRLNHKKVIDAMGFLTNGKDDLVTMMTTTVPVTTATNKSKTRFKNKNKTKSNAIKTPNETQTSVKAKISQHSATCDSFITSYNVHGCNNTIAAVTNYQTTPKLEEIDHDIEGQLLLNKHEDLTNLVVKNEEIDVKQEVTEVDDNETQEMEHSLINKDITQSKRENNVKYRNCDTKNDVTTLYECHKCEFYSPCKESFTRHWKNTHNVYKHTYSCDLCDFKSNRINIKSHMAIMHVNKDAKFVCDYCNYANFSKHHLETHLRLKHKKVIDAMGFLKNGKDDLVTMMTTTVPVTTATNKSKTRFKNKNKTKSNAIKTPNETQTSVKEKISQHSATCDSFITSYNVHGCNNSIAAVTNSQTTPKLEEIDHDIEGQLLLNKHEDLTNLVVKDEEIDVKPVVTEVDYNETPEMKHSLINKDIIQSKRENTVKYHNCDTLACDVTTSYKCDYCDYTSEHKSDFSSHINAKHADKSVTYFCDKCDYNTFYKHHLYRHVRTIHKRVIFACDICDFSCHRGDILNSHIKIKHNHKRFTFFCDKCDFSTHYKRPLMKHMSTKHKDVIYYCDICDFKCTLKRLLRLHVDKMHNNTLNAHLYSKMQNLQTENVTYSCDKCNYTSNDQRCFLQHVIKHE